MNIHPIYYVAHPDGTYSEAKPQPFPREAEPRTYVALPLLEALCAEWAEDTDQYPESCEGLRDAQRDLHELIDKAKAGEL